MNILTSQILRLIKKAIKKFANELDLEINETYIYIYYKNNFPNLKIMQKSSFIMDIEFKDLCSEFDRRVYASFGFNISEDTPKWINEFMTKCSTDNNVEIEKTTYILALINNELKSIMYVDNKQFKHIEIEYILSFF